MFTSYVMCENEETVWTPGLGRLDGPGLSISERSDLLEFSHTTVSKVYSVLCYTVLLIRKELKDDIWNQPDLFRELGIGDQEAGDVALVEETQEGVNLWVHDRLAH